MSIQICESQTQKSRIVTLRLMPTSRSTPAKLQVGSCHGKIEYGPFETVFDGSKVRREVKQAANEVRESLQSQRLVDARSWQHRRPWSSSTELNVHEIRSIYSPMKKGEVSKRRLDERDCAIRNLDRFHNTDMRGFSSHNRSGTESRRRPLWNVSTGLLQEKGGHTIAQETESSPSAVVKLQPVLQDYRSPVERQKEIAAAARRKKELQSEKELEAHKLCQRITLADVKDRAQEEKLNSDHPPENLARFIAQQEAKWKSHAQTGASASASTPKGKIKAQIDHPTFKPVTNNNIPLPSHTHVTSEHRGAWAHSAVEGCHVWSCCLSRDEERVPGCSVQKTIFRRIS